MNNNQLEYFLMDKFESINSLNYIMVSIDVGKIILNMEFYEPEYVAEKLSGEVNLEKIFKDIKDLIPVSLSIDVNIIINNRKRIIKSKWGLIFFENDNKNIKYYDSFDYLILI